ncbi:hypothetical protein WR25_24406 [Diploscapter pachys]|uniref:Uncharacterized protein n=1 Tax=Diploscapter pachys TaxID=2018661 RepID=A0A2A2M5T1_9BILA|nr:hypothetical protein WR25_24406 [Diploscapter pachys]
MIVMSERESHMQDLTQVITKNQSELEKKTKELMELKKRLAEAEKMQKEEAERARNHCEQRESNQILVSCVDEAHSRTR